jgi:hypothetical protein
MADWVMFSWSLSKAIENDSPIKFTPKWIPIPDLPMKVVMDLPPDTESMLAKDPLLMQMIKDDSKQAFTASLSKIVPRLQALDAECGASGGDFFKYAESRKRVLQQIDLDLQQAKTNAVAAVQKRWMQVQQQKKEYKKYRLGVGIKLVKGAAGVAAAAAGIAGAAPTGGASLALSIVGGYRAAMDGVKTLWDCAKDADGVQKRVETGLKKLRDSYAQGQKSGVAREVVASTANALLKEAPVAVINKLSGGALTNVATLEDDNKLWRGKLTHLRFLAHELSEELNELLVNSDKLATQLSADPDSKRKLAALRGFQADINKLLTEGFIVPSMGRRVTIQKSYEDAESGLAAQEQVAKAIEELKAGRSQGVDWYNKIISFVTDAALTAAGYGVSPPNLSSAKDVAGVVSDGATNLAGIYDMVADAVPQVKAIEEKIKKKFEENVTDKIFGGMVAPPRLA